MKSHGFSAKNWSSSQTQQGGGGSFLAVRQERSGSSSSPCGTDVEVEAHLLAAAAGNRVWSCAV